MMIYPYIYPLIMSDDIFQKYGGLLGDTIDEMRTAAYCIAEQFVSEDLNTFLLPTIVTGTYSYRSTLVLDHARVSKVILLRFYDVEEDLYWTVSGTANVYASLRDDGSYGLVDLHQVMANCQNCHAESGVLPYKIQVCYEAGFSSGTSHQSNILMALTMASKIMLNEMLGFGNEAPGDIGVKRYSNQDYSEGRVGLIRTVYGTSAQAQLIHKLLSSYRLYRYVGL